MTYASVRSRHFLWREAYEGDKSEIILSIIYKERVIEPKTIMKKSYKKFLKKIDPFEMANDLRRKKSVHINNKYRQFSDLAAYFITTCETMCKDNSNGQIS